MKDTEDDMEFSTIKIVHTDSGYRVTVDDGEPYYCESRITVRA